MYYGCDSNSNSFPCGTNFYMGRMGYGTTATPGGNGWNQNAANRVGPSKVWGYWGIEGPSSANATTPSQAFSWGLQQAIAAEQAWLANNSIQGLTIFGDIESGFGGWVSDKALNRNVYLGFIEQLNADQAVSGVYSSPGEWSNIMGSYSASPVTCVWSANWLTGSCNSCPTSITGQGFGGFAPSIWQYNGNTGNGTPCPADLDCTNALPA